VTGEKRGCEKKTPISGGGGRCVDDDEQSGAKEGGKDDFLSSISRARG